MSTLQIALQLLQAGLPIAEDVINGVTTEMQLSGQNRAPTPEEQAKIDAALDAAHAALQAAQPTPFSTKGA
jgi:hypothetical protein